MPVVSCDFETRSTVELGVTGVYVYAEHPTTDIWCLCWALDDGPVQTWVPGMPLDPVLVAHICAGGEMRAWNAQFERVIWNHIMVPRYGAPAVALEQWVDTAAEAAAMALPRALGQCAAVVGTPFQKDDAGHRLMLTMCKPRSKKGATSIVWWDVPERVQRLIEYCIKDVEAERALAGALRRLGDRERQVYLLDQRMNDRGVLLDRELTKACLWIVEEGLDRANTEIRQLSDGAIEGVTKTKQMAQFLDVTSVAKASVRELLAGDLPSEQRRILELRAEAGRSSTAKLRRLQQCASRDGRLRGGLLYHGAATGRWAGKAWQPQNFPRGDVADVEQYIPLIQERAYDTINLLEAPLAVVSSLLRGCLIAAPGKLLAAADYSAIEARVNAWLAGQEDLLELFRKGGKVYETFAAAVLGLNVADVKKGSWERQLGKAGVLGCGFQMGAEKFRDAAKEQYGIEITEELAEETVSTFRRLYGRIKDLWYALDAAAVAAVAEPGLVTRAGAAENIRFVKRGAYLWMILPSGRPLAYPAPQLVVRDITIKKKKADGTEYEETFQKRAVKTWGIDSVTRKWSPYYLYGGLLCENAVQAVARDLMAEAMLRVDEKGHEVILTVHDEIVTEVAATVGLSELEQLMAETPAWAAGCPIAVEGWIGPRYRK